MLLFRLDMITFTHKYRKVVGVDETGEEKDASTCVICLQGNFALRIDISSINYQRDIIICQINKDKNIHK